MVSIETVKLSVNSKIEKVVFGAECTSSEKRVNAINTIRCGSFDKVRLGSLIGLDDKGTSADPLLSFRNLEDPSGKFSLALGHMQTITNLAMPTQSIVTSSFFSELKTQIDRHRERGATWVSLSKWVSAIFKRVATEAKRALAENRQDPQLLHLKWLTEASEHLTALTDSIFDARADAAGAKRGNPDKRGGGEPKNKKSKLKDGPQPEAGNKTAREEVDKGGVITPRGENGGPSHAQVKAMGAKHPKKDGKFPCWWSHAGHDCKYGTSCSFYHK